MGYNLTIDQGNSSAKVAVWNGNDIVFDAVLKQLGDKEIDEIISRYPISGAMYCSVACDGRDIIAYLQKCGIATLNLSDTTPLPIANAYKTPQSLGRDRIAAAVGAWSNHKGCDILVIDLGTAVTYDVVTANGCYIGGNIAPGVSMRLEALHNYTSRLPLVDCTGNCPMWGEDTITAIRSGVLNGIVGEINHYKNQLSQSPIVILTGGNATMIGAMLNFAHEIDHHLVTRGLNCILRYNENN